MAEAVESFVSEAVPDKASNAAGRQPWHSAALRILISCFFLALALSVSLAYTQPEGHVATLWLGDGLQLGVLLLSPGKHGASFVAAFFVTTLVVMWSFGSVPAMVIGAAISNCLEALLAALFLSRDPDWVSGQSDRLGAWARFALI